MRSQRSCDTTYDPRRVGCVLKHEPAYDEIEATVARGYGMGVGLHNRPVRVLPQHALRQIRADDDPRVSRARNDISQHTTSAAADLERDVHVAPIDRVEQWLHGLTQDRRPQMRVACRVAVVAATHVSNGHACTLLP